MDEKTDFWLALFAMGLSVVNVVLNLIDVPETFLKPFSIALSVLIFYLGWQVISELELTKRIKLLFFIYHLEKEAFRKAKKVIENAGK